jgi:D-sedoheptulose 7-phosphate isomerase
MSPEERVIFARNYTTNLSKVLGDLPFEAIGKFLHMLEKAYLARRHVFIAGNGGSAATASHMANDLLWGVAQRGRPGFRAIALSDNVPVLTAIANDKSYQDVFSVQLEALGDRDDVLVVITGSGNSPNIVRLVEVAREKGLTTIGFLGFGGGKVAPLVDIPITIPSHDYGPVEDLHMMLDHLCIAHLRAWVDRGCPAS